MVPGSRPDSMRIQTNGNRPLQYRSSSPRAIFFDTWLQIDFIAISFGWDGRGKFH